MKTVDNYINAKLPADFYTHVKTLDFNRQIYPCYAERSAWDEKRKDRFAKVIIDEADSVIQENEVPQLLFSNYSQFKRTGDRTGYEAPYFKRRKNLAFLALALCLTCDEEKYMPRLLDHTVAILEEATWCIPAHAQWTKNNIDRWRFCDLFVAETGAVMALLVTILGDELEKYIPGICETIRVKTLERTVYTVFDKNIVHPWDIHENPANWTPWCSSNCIITALLLEPNGNKLVRQLKRFLADTSRFISNYSDDGYCPEGPGYYTKAGLMVFQTMLILEKTFPGSMDELFRDSKLKAMMEFLPNARLGSNNVVTFGDSKPGLCTELALLLPAGKYFNSAPLAEFNALEDYLLGHNGDFLPNLLVLLFDRPAELPQKFSCGEKATVFQDRLAVLRSEKLSLSLKAGCNAEPHNHNDLGHFELFSGDLPVIIDAGTGIYAQINFSKLRYTLWYTRGNGHNAPVFGEYEQLSGPEYYSTFQIEDDRIIRCDLSHAYPEAAGVEQAERIIEYTPDMVVVEDSFTLKETLPVAISLLTTAAPEVRDNTHIQLGNVLLSMEGIVLSEITQAPELLQWRSEKPCSIWGKISVIKLESRNNRYKLTFRCQ